MLYNGKLCENINTQLKGEALWNEQKHVIQT